jgi:putative transposase
MISFKGTHFAKEIILTCVRWYVTYPLSYCQLDELMQERGVAVDHATIHRWVLKYAPQLEEAFHRRKRLVYVSWRLDETYIRVRGQWHYLSRTVDKTGQTIDFLLTTRRDCTAAIGFRIKAIRHHEVPKPITIDGSEANAAAIRCDNAEHRAAIGISQVGYLINVLEQDHRGIKQQCRPTGGFRHGSTAAYCCRLLDAVRALRRPPPPRHHSLSLKQRRAYHRKRCARLIRLPPTALPREACSRTSISPG